jgi:hypothetical protein
LEVVTLRDDRSSLSVGQAHSDCGENQPIAGTIQATTMVKAQIRTIVVLVTSDSWAGLQVQEIDQRHTPCKASAICSRTSFIP